MPLFQPVITALQEFECAFSQPTWSKMQVLIIGTLFARGRHTVTAALRHLGLSKAPHFNLYQRGRNRARWSTLEWRRRLLLV